jgi:predicted nucleic acid-binding protein
MIVIDTSVWIEFFRQTVKTTSELVSSYLDDGEVIALSPIFGELLQGSKSDDEEKIILEFWRSLPKINETDLWIEAGRLSNKKKFTSKGIGLIDSFILVAVKFNKLSLWTLDKKLLKEYQDL